MGTLCGEQHAAQMLRGGAGYLVGRACGAPGARIERGSLEEQSRWGGNEARAAAGFEANAGGREIG